MKFLNGQSSTTQRRKGKRKNQRAVQEMGKFVPSGFNAKVNYEIETIYRSQQPTAKAKSLMNLHNNEAGRRVSIRFYTCFFICATPAKYTQTKCRPAN